jgi:hypothetical protein
MLKAGAVLSLLLIAVTAVAAQSQCAAKLAELPQPPELSGFHLGMTTDQVKARVPQVKFGRTDPLGLSKTTINPYFDPSIDKTNFADVRSVSLDLLDGKVISLWLGFENTFKWKTVDEFVAEITQSLHLTGEWTAKGRAQQLRCADFELSVSTIAGGPSLRILDLSGDETLAARRQAREDAAEAEANAPEPTPVVGDTRNKIFYPIDCVGLKAVPENKRLAFESPAAAEKAGYKKAVGCRDE